MGIISQEITKEQIEKQIQLNSYTIRYNLQLINYQGQSGYFIPLDNYKLLRNDILNYIYYQDLVVIKDERIKQLEKYEIQIAKYKTGLGISISFNVGISLVAIATGILCYNLARSK